MFTTRQGTHQPETVATLPKGETTDQTTTITSEKCIVCWDHVADHVLVLVTFVFVPVARNESKSVL